MLVRWRIVKDLITCTMTLRGFLNRRIMLTVYSSSVSSETENLDERRKEKWIRFHNFNDSCQIFKTISAQFARTINQRWLTGTSHMATVLLMRDVVVYVMLTIVQPQAWWFPQKPQSYWHVLLFSITVPVSMKDGNAHVLRLTDYGVPQ